MDDFIEKHFQEWLEFTIRDENERKEVEISIRELLKDYPDLIEKNYSWPDMRKMVENK